MYIYLYTYSIQTKKSRSTLESYASSCVHTRIWYMIHIHKIKSYAYTIHARRINNLILCFISCSHVYDTFTQDHVMRAHDTYTHTIHIHTWYIHTRGTYTHDLVDSGSSSILFSNRDNNRNPAPLHKIKSSEGGGPRLLSPLRIYIYIPLEDIYTCVIKSSRIAGHTPTQYMIHIQKIKPYA